MYIYVPNRHSPGKLLGLLFFAGVAGFLVFLSIALLLDLRLGKEVIVWILTYFLFLPLGFAAANWLRSRWLSGTLTSPWQSTALFVEADTDIVAGEIMRRFREFGWRLETDTDGYIVAYTTTLFFLRPERVTASIERQGSLTRLQIESKPVVPCILDMGRGFLNVKKVVDSLSFTWELRQA